MHMRFSASKELTGMSGGCLFELGQYFVYLVVGIAAAFACFHLLAAVAAANAFFVQKGALRSAGAFKFTILQQ